jgi:uncharacterized protein
MHLFRSQGSLFLFDPFSVRLVKLSKKEYDRFTSWKEDGREESQAEISSFKMKKKGALRGADCAPRVLPPSERIEILVNATHLCNLACQYCFVGHGQFQFPKKNPKQLEPRHAEKLITALPEAFPDAKEFIVHFYGGEPLLNTEAMGAAVAAAERSKYRFGFAITTNGTVFESKVFSLLKRARFNVILSIDGPARIHDAVRKTLDGLPTHGIVMKFLRCLKKEGIFVRGSSVVRKGWPLHKASAYLQSLPVNLIKAQAVRLPSGHPLSLNDLERAQYFKDLKELAGSVIASVREGTCPRDDRFNTRVFQILCRIKRTSFCGAGRSIFGMDAEGTILPCVLLAGSDAAGLGCIDGSAEWGRRGRIWAESHGPREECRKCWALPLCGGGCPAMMSVCGEDECEMVRANCEAALEIYGAFINRPSDLLALAGGV